MSPDDKGQQRVGGCGAWGWQGSAGVWAAGCSQAVSRARSGVGGPSSCVTDAHPEAGAQDSVPRAWEGPVGSRGRWAPERGSGSLESYSA